MNMQPLKGYPSSSEVRLGGVKVVRDSHWIQGPRYKKKSPGSRRDRGEVPIGVWEKQKPPTQIHQNDKMEISQ